MKTDLLDFAHQFKRSGITLRLTRSLVNRCFSAGRIWIAYLRADLSADGVEVGHQLPEEFHGPFPRSATISFRENNKDSMEYISIYFQCPRLSLHRTYNHTAQGAHQQVPTHCSHHVVANDAPKATWNLCLLLAWLRQLCCIICSRRALCQDTPLTLGVLVGWQPSRTLG